MFDLFTSFDSHAAMARIRDRVAVRLTMIRRAPAPNHEGMIRAISQSIEDYIEEMVRCRGHESKLAKYYLEDLHSNLWMLEACGILADTCVDRIDEIMQELLFDELRRCGIGKVGGYFADMAEFRGCRVMNNVSLAELMKKCE